jgi:hypothetical protein
MNRLILLFTLTSMSVILVTLERFSFTTRIILQPYGFLRLHEVFQMLIVIPVTVVIPYFLLKTVSADFSLLKSRRGTVMGAVFILGMYLYATGNGVHELGSFLFNRYCDAKTVTADMCGGMFFNDYYFGNILYFAGGILMNVVLMSFERQRPRETDAGPNAALLAVNAVIYALAIFAYAAFDRVLVGFVYAALMTLIGLLYLFSGKRPFIRQPVTTYLVLAYGLGTVASMVVRFRP